MPTKKQEKLQEINLEVSEYIDTQLNEFTLEPVFDCNELIVLEDDVKNYVVSAYESLFKEEDKKELFFYIDITAKVNLVEGFVGIFPGNLFTALLFNSKFNFKISPKECSELTNYQLDNGSVLCYDRERNLLVGTVTH